MRIVTNPGSNLSVAAIERYDVRLTPQVIVVDDKPHDTRGDIPLEDIDRWVRTAKVHPYVVGTTAAEFVGIFRDVARNDREILAVMTSRKVIGSHDAAVSAARTLSQATGGEAVKVLVADSGATDLAAGLATMLAGESMRAGRSLEDAAAIVEACRKSATFRFVPQTLDYLVKGGRATSLRAWLANLLSVRPVVGFVDGEVKAIDRVSSKEPAARSLAALAEREHRQGRAIWAGIFHGGVEPAALVLERELRDRFDVRWSCVRPLCPSIYLHAGPGALGYAIVPLDQLGWDPPVPPI
jgi:DegV family protein with EDD domain